MWHILKGKKTDTNVLLLVNVTYICIISQVVHEQVNLPSYLNKQFSPSRYKSNGDSNIRFYVTVKVAYVTPPE